MHVDAAAARGILEHEGLSKVHYIYTDVFWLQEQAAQRLLPLYRVLGLEGVSYLLTKIVTAATILVCLQRMGLRYVEWRSGIGQQLHAICEHGTERVAVASCWGIM